MATTAKTEIERKQKWLDDVVTRMSQQYQRRDSRIQVITTINGLFIAADTFLVGRGGSGVAFKSFLAVSMCATVTAILVALWSFRPIVSSGKSAGSSPNLRSVAGIQTFQDWQAYEVAVQASDQEGHLRDTIRQAYGMAHVVKSTAGAIGWSVRATMIAALGLALAAIVQANSADPASSATAKPLPNPSVQPSSHGKVVGRVPAPGSKGP